MVISFIMENVKNSGTNFVVRKHHEMLNEKHQLNRSIAPTARSHVHCRAYFSRFSDFQG